MNTKLRYLLLVALSIMVCSCSSMYGNSMYAEDAIDFMEGQAEADDHKPFDYQAAEWDNTAAAEGRKYEPTDENDDHLDDLTADPDLFFCPLGCKSQKASCNIKRNISMDGEKIYHLPGQKYYEETKINPEYGERWFCHEDEAIANGWRKAKILLQ